MKNNKGFIATSLILTFFLLFCALLLNTIRNYNFNQNLIDKLDDIKFEQTENDKKCSDDAFEEWTFKYVTKRDHDYQVFTADCTGNFTIELWGASGGGNSAGGYTRGTIRLREGTTLYIYVGEKGSTTTEQTGMSATFNGGGAGGDPGSKDEASYIGGASGGGATDVRLVSGSWDNQDSLRSRIMVAGGGGGLNVTSHGYGGGLNGYNGSVISNGKYVTQLSGLGGKSGTQVGGGSFTDKTGINNKETIDGSFGKGGAGDKGGDKNGKCRGEGGGGGGYYGGSGGSNASGNCYDVGGGGGSSYISGHTGCIAITSATDEAPKSGCTQGTTDNSCSIHYSKKKFTNTLIIDGGGYTWTNDEKSKARTNLMPMPSDGTYASGIGHTGNGSAKITLNYK